MFRKNNSLQFVAYSILSIVAVTALYNIYGVNNAFAHTASITTSGTINLDVSASGNGANVAEDKLTVNSTCSLGYTISIQGPADSTLYKDGNKANNSTSSKIMPTSGTIANPLPITGDDGSGNSYLGTWGYSMTNNSATGTFIGLINQLTELTTKSGASADGGDKYSVFYGASVSHTIEPGQYKLAESTEGANDNVITYFLTTNPACSTYYIRYNDNDGQDNLTSGLMADQEITSTNTDITLVAPNFKYSGGGYGFAGWSTEELDPNASDFKAKLSTAVSNGKVYGPNETILADDLEDFLNDNTSVENNSQYVDLYAVWVKSEGDIQNWNGCSSMNIGDITALTDTRDNQTYAIAKLADGGCWMVENLRLGGLSPITLDSTTTNIADGATFTLPAIQDPTRNAWCTDSNATCIDQPLVANSLTIDHIDAKGTPGGHLYGYGNYYNWYTATAGTGTYSKTSGNAEGDICPAGWHLPTGNTGGEFGALDTVMGGTGDSQSTTESSMRWREYPNNFIYAGFVVGSTQHYRGSVGRYWSSTADSDSSSYYLGLDSSNVYPGTGRFGSKHNGQSIRCIANKVAHLDTGQTVNQKLKRLAGDSLADHSTEDNNITALARSDTLPSGFTPTTANTISTTTSGIPIYAWYDSGTIYYYSDATIIKMNQDSSYFFFEMRALSDLSTISSWDTSSVTNMYYMFSHAGYNATTWSVGDLSSWNTASVTDMSLMFFGAGYSATTFTLNLSSWNTASVTDMSSMFRLAGYNATTWSVGDLSSWDTSSVTDMSNMFSNAGYSAATFTLNLSSWDTSSVKSISGMFYNAGYSATTFTLNLSSWNTSKVTSMSSMFSYAGYNATTFTLDLSSWNTSKVTSMSSMFSYAGYNATTWSVGDLSSWNTASVTNMSSMFLGAGYSATTWSVGDLSSWNTASVTNMFSMFFGAGYSATIFTLNLSSWNTSSVTSMSSMFYNAGYSATTWSVGDLSSWNTSSVTSMSFMFYNAGRSATTWSVGDLSSWDTSKVTTMSSMFFGAGYSATTFTLNLSSWNTSSVTGMSSMFYSAGRSATTWSVTIPKTNKGSTPITNTTTRLYGNTTSVYAEPLSGKTFTLAN